MLIVDYCRFNQILALDFKIEVQLFLFRGPQDAAGVIRRVGSRVFHSSGNWEVKKLSGEKWIDHSAAGLSSPGVPGVPWHPQILTDQLILSQPGGTDYAHQIILAPPNFQTFLRPFIILILIHIRIAE